MQGQVNHFNHYHFSKESEQYSKDRYTNETRRLYRVLDKHLQESRSKFLVGDKLTVADLATFPWANILGGSVLVVFFDRRLRRRHGV